MYIPNFEGYFKDSFTIFKIHINSILNTIHTKTRITIFNNNCIKEVEEYIYSLYKQHKEIDQVFNSKRE